MINLSLNIINMSKYNQRAPHSKITISSHKPNLSSIRSISIKTLGFNLQTEANPRFQSPNVVLNINPEEYDTSNLQLKCEIPWSDDIKTQKYTTESLNTDHIGRFSKDVSISPKGFRTPPKLPLKYKVAGLIARNSAKVKEQIFPWLSEHTSPTRNGVREPSKKIAYYNLLRTKDIRSHKTPRIKKSNNQIHSPREIKLSPPSPFCQNILPDALSHKTQLSPDGNIFYYKSFNFSSNSRITRKAESKSSNRSSVKSIVDNHSRRTLYNNYSKILLGEERDTGSIERNLDIEGQRLQTRSNARRSYLDKEARDSPIEQM